jgi:hypothetical protein
MAMKEFQVTVDFHKARSRGEVAVVEIASLIETISSARVLAGDPNISVQVGVDEKQQALLLAAVKEFCLVEEYSDLELY